MARNREYDLDDVLDKAVQLFWRQGYKATSVNDIVHATGLNTASMYKEFGDKDGVFEAALAHYREHIIGPRIRTLTEQPNIEGVEMFINSVINGAASPEYKGCLMMNHLSQQHSISPRAAKEIDEFCAMMEYLLAKALANAKAAGEIPAEKDPVTLASFIMCSVHGLVLYGRHPEKKRDLANLYDVIVRAVRG